MSTLKHTQTTYWILSQIKSINPYTTSPTDRKGNIYAYGFLASYLANLLAEDPIMRRQFEKHIERVKKGAKQHANTLNSSSNSSSSNPSIYTDNQTR